MIDLFLIAAVFLGILLTILFISVLRGAAHNRGNTVFSLLILASLAWTVTNYLAEIVRVEGAAFFFVAATYAIGILIAMLFLHFSLVFPVPLKSAKVFIFLGYALSVTLAALSFSSLIVEAVHVNEPINDIISGVYLTFYSAIFLLLIIAGIVVISWKLFRLPDYRQKLLYVLIGIVLTLTGATATNLIIPLFSSDYSASRFGPLFLLFFLAFTGFAILRHQLFSIKILATEFFITFLSLFLIGRVFFSASVTESLVNILIASAVIILGLLVIRSVVLEVKRRKEIERLNRQLGDFLRFGVHELRAPLGGIRGHTSMMLEGAFGELNDKLKRSVKIVHSQVDQLLLIVETFLNANRARSGNLEVVVEPTNVKRSIDNVLDTMNTKFELKNLELKTDIPSNLPAVVADPRKIQIVIGNIVSNAIKYTSKGYVKISAKRVGDKVKIIVSDTGIGIPKNKIPQLFTQFERGSDKAKKMATGSGIGLYLTKKLMHAMQGAIDITSRGVDKGSTATLTFKTSSGKPRL